MWLFGRPKMGQEGEIEEWKGEGEEEGGEGAKGAKGAGREGKKSHNCSS